MLSLLLVEIAFKSFGKLLPPFHAIMVRMSFMIPWLLQGHRGGTRDPISRLQGLIKGRILDSNEAGQNELCSAKANRENCIFY